MQIVSILILQPRSPAPTTISVLLLCSQLCCCCGLHRQSCCLLSSYSNCPKTQFKKQPFQEWASSNKTWRYKENDLEPPSSRRWVVNLFTHAEYLPWSSYDMHMHADLLSFPWLFIQMHAGGAAQGSERKACHQCSSAVIIKAVQAFRVWPLMLGEAWFSLHGWLSVKIRRPVYAENSNQLCFFASFISFSVSPLSWLATQCTSNCKTACTYELQLSSTLPPH